MKYKFQNLEQCRVYLSASKCKNLLVYFDLYWELALFLFDTVSAIVEYIAVQKLKIDIKFLSLSIPNATNVVS